MTASFHRATVGSNSPRKGDIPCIVAPGAIDYICKGPFETLDPAWQQRLHIIHNRNITNIRTTAAELDRAARFMAERLSRAIGPIRVMIPLKGFSEPDAAGKPFYDPGADRTFVDVLKTHMRADIDIVERPHHINDDRFVREGGRHHDGHAGLMAAVRGPTETATQKGNPMTFKIIPAQYRFHHSGQGGVRDRRATDTARTSKCRPGHFTSRTARRKSWWIRE